LRRKEDVAATDPLAVQVGAGAVSVNGRAAIAAVVTVVLRPSVPYR
jgi:hypothetical protein